MENLIIKDVECRINEYGIAELNLEHVARGLGFIKRDVKNDVSYERINKQFLQRHLYSFGILNSENEELPHFVTENIFYKLCFKAENETARQFQDLVTDEILPSIRKRGIYATSDAIEKILSDPETAIRLLSEIKEERQKRAELEKENEKMKAKVEFVDRIIDSDEKIDIGQAAKILKLPYGRNTLFKKLREMGVFFANRNEPKQIYIDRGYFDLTEKYIDRNEHDGFMVIKVLVTQKGLEFLSSKLECNITKSKIIKIA